MLGRIFAAVIVRELGPLLTAIIVIGRSGTAIAAELATDRVLGETEAIESMGSIPCSISCFRALTGVAPLPSHSAAPRIGDR